MHNVIMFCLTKLNYKENTYLKVKFKKVSLIKYCLIAHCLDTYIQILIGKKYYENDCGSS